MIEKQCVICDEIFFPKVDRYDNVTCSVACRSKLHRERRKAVDERKATAAASDEQRMMRWFKQNIPDIAHNLNKIKVIHGDDAFQLASQSLKSLVKHNLRKQKKPHSLPREQG